MISSQPHWILGIDPATNGAAILLAPEGDAVVGWCWRTRTEKSLKVWEVAVVQPPFFRLERRKSIHGISVLIHEGLERVVDGEKVLIGCEAPHIALDPSAGLSVAMTTGKMIGPLEETADLGISFCLPGEWRAEVLKLKRTTKREDAKPISLAEIPKKIEGLKEILETTAKIFGWTIDKLDHITDAGGVALMTERQATSEGEAGYGRNKKRKSRSTKKTGVAPVAASAIIPVVGVSPKKGRARKADRG